MSAVVKTLPAGARGIDTNQRLTAATAKALVDAGATFAMRYVPLFGNSLGFDLTKPELDACLEAGLAVGIVQHVRKAGLWMPSATFGENDGARAVSCAEDAGVPAGCHIFYDMEGPSAATTPADVAAYDFAWCAIVKEAGFIPAGYFGYGLKNMTPELMWGLKVELYWKSGSYAVPPAVCGWAIEQQLPFDQTVGGVKVDWDVVFGDLIGRLPAVCGV